MANSSELGKYFGPKFRSTNDGDKLSQVNPLVVKTWIEKAQKSIRRGGNLIELSSQEVKQGNGSSIVTVWKPSSGHGTNLDIYLSNPRFKVTEASKKGHFLHLKLNLEAVNEVSLDNVMLSLDVHLLQ